MCLLSVFVEAKGRRRLKWLPTRKLSNTKLKDHIGPLNTEPLIRDRS